MGLSYPPSKMRDVVELQRNNETLSATYSRVENWETVVSTRAWVEQLRGSQRFQYDHLGHEATHVVHMRYRGNLDTTMQLKWGTRVLKVVYVRPVTLFELEVLCNEEL